MYAFYDRRPVYGITDILQIPENRVKTFMVFSRTLFLQQAPP